ncbi:MAG: hypothetical protein AB7O74_07560 [Candidatus Nanopelagicales bacterium]
MRSHDDVLALTALWAAVVVGGVLVISGTRSWLLGLVIGPVLAGATYLPFRLRRRRWDAAVGRAFEDGLVRLERLLDDQRPPDRPA